MMSTTKWYIKKIICKNGVEERTKYPVRSEYKSGVRAKREANRGFVRADNAMRQVARLLNNNFELRDKHFVLSYSDKQFEKLLKKAEQIAAERKEDRIFLAAEKELENFIRRVRRALKCGAVKYIGVTSDMDGKTGELVRVHHHFIVNAENAELCKEKWRGIVLEKQLYNTNGDLSALAEYLVRQVRTIGGKKRYKPSRNLEQPLSEEPVLLVGNAAKYAENEMRLPKGCKLLYRSTYVRGASQYIRYLRPTERGGEDGNKVQDAADGEQKL